MASGITADRSGRLISFIENRSVEVLEQLAEKVVERAKELVPVRTGDLRDSIHAEILKTRVKIIADAKNDSGHSYAYYVETGTGRGPAQPFLRPALQSVIPDIQRSFSNWKWI